MLRLIHCLWEAEKRKRGGGSRRRNETESRSRNKDLETKQKEGWHRGMHKSCLFLHLLKLNIHTNYKAEMKNTGRLIWFYPFKQWNYFLNDFFPLSVPVLSLQRLLLSHLSFPVFLFNATFLCSFFFASVCIFLPLPFFSCSPLSFLSCPCSPTCSLSTRRTRAQIVEKHFSLIFLFYPHVVWLLYLC